MSQRYLSLLADVLTDDIYRPYDPAKGWPSHAFSMIGRTRMRHLKQACEQVLCDGVAGAFVETGICRGGALMMMAAVAQEDPVFGRHVWGFDSFSGVPRPYTPQDATQNLHLQTALAVPKAQVEKNFQRLELMSERVHLIEGFFIDTLPAHKAEVGPIAVLRLDGDLYASTQEALEHLYPQLEPGGYCIIDDYNISQCKLAVDEYRAAHNITTEMQRSDFACVWWRK